MIVLEFRSKDLSLVFSCNSSNNTFPSFILFSHPSNLPTHLPTKLINQYARRSSEVRGSSHGVSINQCLTGVVHPGRSFKSLISLLKLKTHFAIVAKVIRIHFI